MEYLAIDEYQHPGPVHLLPADELTSDSLCGVMPEGDWAAANPELSRLLEEMHPEAMCPDCCRIRDELPKDSP